MYIVLMEIMNGYKIVLGGNRPQVVISLVRNFPWGDWGEGGSCFILLKQI